MLKMHTPTAAVVLLLIAMVAVCTAVPLGDNKINRRKRVIVGEPITRGEFPFHVSLWYSGVLPYVNNTDNMNHVCGGALVANQWVLSSVSCFYDDWVPGLSILNMWQAKLGMHRQTRAGDEAQSCSIVQVSRPPEYNVTQYYGLLALVKLGCEAQLSDTVATIDINEDSACPEVNQSVTTIGWGRTQLIGTNSDIPHKATMKTTSNEFCRQRWTSDPDIHRAVPYQRFDEGVMCAARPEVIATHSTGAAGSPLLAKCDGPNSPTVAVGIMSYSQLDVPSVFVRLSYFKDWITETISNN